jgi:hypothetical protein
MMDKPVPFWFIILNIVVIIIVSFLIYKWLKSLKEIE